MASNGSRSERYSFGQAAEVLELPNLLDVQLESYRWLLSEGLRQAFEDISPIEDYSGRLSLELKFDPRSKDNLGEVKYSPEECREKDLTYGVPIYVEARLRDNLTGVVSINNVYIGELPLMTDKGTFIINGTERVVVSQLVRSPGVLFQPGKEARTLVVGTIHPYRGEWLEMDVEYRPNQEVSAGARVARKRRVSLFLLLAALGIGNPEFLERLARRFDFLMPQWERDSAYVQDRNEAVRRVFSAVRSVAEAANVEAAKQYLDTVYFHPKRYELTRVGRYKLNKKLARTLGVLNDELGCGFSMPAEDVTVLTPFDVAATAVYLLNLAVGEEGYRLDDQDHFANRRVRTVGELVQNQLKVGLTRMERVVRERMTTQDPEMMTPANLINARPVMAAVKEFFATSQLSQFMDQVNPLSGLAHKRRLSALGPGGLSRERAGFEVRDVHTSHYGRMCPIETPEGPNIGLIGALATYARVNKFGFIETPYRKVVEGRVTDEIVWLTADEEEDHVIAQSTEPLDQDGRFRNKRVLARRAPKAPSLLGASAETGIGTTSEVDLVDASEVDLMDVSPKQIVSVSTSLIPFLEHDDANRALMGANMQKQAVPLLVPEAPFIGTGVESRAAFDSREVIVAEADGKVTRVSGDLIEVSYGSGAKRADGTALPAKVSYSVPKFRRSNQNTCINYRIRVSPGQRVRAGEVLAEGPSVHNGELALGKNLLVAFMPWEGYNYEDAIIVSERLVRDDVLTSIHVLEHEVFTRQVNPLGKEEITRDIPNLPEEMLANLDERGRVRVGAQVAAGDVLVGKVTPKGETELSPEERLLRALFGEKARDVRDTSLRLPHGEYGIVTQVKHYDKESAITAQAGILELVRVYVAQRRKVQEGDKLAGRHGNKGVIAKILPVEDMPYLEDGTPVDIILNPLGVPSRMNIGQVLEAHLGYVAKHGAPQLGEEQASEGDGSRGRAGRRKTAPAEAPARWIASPAFDGAHWDEKDKAGDKPTIKELLGSLKPEGKNGRRLVGEDGKAILYDGRTGEPYEHPVTVGYVYMMKLNHLVDDKIHARSTGPYAMITQQPLGGKAQFGGQRFGEMEVWALEAYGAAYALQELLTLKSDDRAGRMKVYESIVKGENIPPPSVPESFKVLVKEMQALALEVEIIGAGGQELELKESDEDERIEAQFRQLGVSMERPEKGGAELMPGELGGRS
jgi:DNA-directed RNA polymerase subunit beta